MRGWPRPAHAVVGALACATVCCCAIILWLAGRTVMQVSNGYSILDDDAPQGLRLRKWFLLLIALLALVRCAAAAMELFIRLSLVDFGASARPRLWLLRNVPSLLFVCVSWFMNDYLWRMIEMLDLSTKHVFSLRYLFLCALIFLFFVALFFEVRSAGGRDAVREEHMQSSCIVLAMNGLLLVVLLSYSTFSIARSLLRTSLPNAARVLARFLLLYLTQLLFVLAMTSFRFYEGWNKMELDRGSLSWSEIQEHISILVCECLNSLLVLIIITNGGGYIEELLRKTVLRRRTFFSASAKKKRSLSRESLAAEGGILLNDDEFSRNAQVGYGSMS